MKRPVCYNPNDAPYPLCKGANKTIAEHDCRTCNLYEDMEEHAYDMYDA
jgi:hypothetical protein